MTVVSSNYKEKNGGGSLSCFFSIFSLRLFSFMFLCFLFMLSLLSCFFFFVPCFSFFFRLSIPLCFLFRFYFFLLSRFYLLFFFSLISSLILSSPTPSPGEGVFIKGRERKSYLTPIQSWRRGRVAGVGSVQPPQSHPQGLSPLPLSSWW